MALSALAPTGLREELAAAVAGADAGLRALLPPSRAGAGAVHLVSAGSLQTPDGTEVVLHAMLDYDDSAAGSRHLLSLAAHRPTSRVHLVDVRLRGRADSLEPMAEAYAGSTEPVWTWHVSEELDALVGPAVRETSRQAASRWPVADLDGAPTPVWALAVARLGHVTGSPAPS